MVSIIIPTRNRHQELARTLVEIRQLRWPREPEIIVIDNASESPVCLGDESRVEYIRLERNAGAAARNVGAERASHPWLLMLDDDSAPIDCAFQSLLDEAPADVFAIGAEIVLPSGAHESGGLPEVPIGCGVLIRREAFFKVGGYDETFGYYAEEYDLAAKLLHRGGRIVHDGRFAVLHRKAPSQRSFDTIIARLVRNNAWVRARYAPAPIRIQEIEKEIERYREIAHREGVLAGFERGLSELRGTLDSQSRHELPQDLYERFTGEIAARATLGPALDWSGATSVNLVNRGKGDDVIERLCREFGVGVMNDSDHSEVEIIGTLSPGPMLDAIAELGPEFAGEEDEMRKPRIPAWAFPNARFARAAASGDMGTLEKRGSRRVEPGSEAGLREHAVAHLPLGDGDS